MKQEIYYGRHEITEEDIEAVTSVLRSDWVTQGPRLLEFEQAFADYVGAPFAVAVSSGSAALHLAIRVLAVKKGDRVITTPITFVATAHCIRHCEGEVVFADIDPATFLIDLNAVEDILKKDRSRTVKGVVPVDLAGLPVDLESLREIATRYGVWILEDACHAPGASFAGKNGVRFFCGDGRLADLSVFSFHPVKHITTGEGGMITTGSRDLYQQLRRLRNNGIEKSGSTFAGAGNWTYDVEEPGYNYRLSNMQAALGISQLRRARQGLARRRQLAARYAATLSDLPGIRYQRTDPGMEHAYHLFIIQTGNRKELYDYLHLHGIRAQVHYIPIYRLSYYRRAGGADSRFPHAEAYYESCLSLPLYPALRDADQDRVIELIHSFTHSVSSR